MILFYFYLILILSQNELSIPQYQISSMRKSSFSDSLSVFPNVLVAAELPFSRFLFIKSPYFTPIPIPIPWSFYKYTKKSFLVVHPYTYGYFESPLKVKMNIQPLPVLPASMLSTKKAPKMLPLYSLINKIAGSTSLILFKNV